MDNAGHTVSESTIDREYDENGIITNAYYEQELRRLQTELAKLQYWTKDQGWRIVVLFEGREAAGKGAMIRAIMQRLNPRMAYLLTLVPYKDLTPELEELSPRPEESQGYVRPPMSQQSRVPAIYGQM